MLPEPHDCRGPKPAARSCREPGAIDLHLIKTEVQQSYERCRGKYAFLALFSSQTAVLKGTWRGTSKSLFCLAKVARVSWVDRVLEPLPIPSFWSFGSAKGFTAGASLPQRKSRACVGTTLHKGSARKPRRSSESGGKASPRDEAGYMQTDSQNHAAQEGGLQSAAHAQNPATANVCQIKTNCGQLSAVERGSSESGGLSPHPHIRGEAYYSCFSRIHRIGGRARRRPMSGRRLSRGRAEASHIYLDPNRSFRPAARLAIVGRTALHASKHSWWARLSLVR